MLINKLASRPIIGNEYLYKIDNDEPIKITLVGESPELGRWVARTESGEQLYVYGGEIYERSVSMKIPDPN